MSTSIPEQPFGDLSPLQDTENVKMERVEQDEESLEYVYALLASSPLPAVSVEEEL